MLTFRRPATLRRVFLMLALSASAAWALPPASGPVILRMSGKVEDRNAPNAATFDLAMIEKLPQQSFTTKTPWDKEPVKFTGPLLRDLLAAAGANGSVVKAVALNDYKISIPIEDARRYGVIVAHRINDEPIPVRTKGPLFVIYPFDSLPELQSQKFYERSIWQLKAIEVE